MQYFLTPNNALGSRGILQVIRDCFAESAAPYNIMVSSKKIEVMYWLAHGETLCATKYFPWQFKADNGHYSLFSKACCSLVWFIKRQQQTAHFEEMWQFWDECGFESQVNSGDRALLQSRLEMWRERLPPFPAGPLTTGLPTLSYLQPRCLPHLQAITWQATFPNRFLTCKLYLCWGYTGFKMSLV